MSQQTKAKQFNALAKTDDQKKADACAVLAQWWADQLPCAESFSRLEFVPDFDGSAMDDVHILKAAVRAKHQVTKDQYFAFREALFDELKNRQPTDHEKHIRVSTYFSDASIKNALARAQIDNGNLALPSDINTYIQHDRRVVVPSKESRSLVVLSHESQPEMPYKQFDAIKPNKWQHYRREDQYLVVDLEAGQDVFTIMPVRNGPRTTFQRAATGQVLVIEKADNEHLNALKKDDWISLFNPEKVEWSSVKNREDYPDTEKVKESGGVVQRMDGEGHYRELSKPFKAMKVTEPFAWGDGSRYHAAQPGDYICEEKPGGAFYLIKKEWLESGRMALFPSTPDGTLVDLSQVKEPTSPSLLDRLKFWRH